MKFLVDAQLPLRVARWLNQAGHDAVHTLDMPDGNRTSDADIIALSMRDARIVVTKDGDFVRTFMLSGRPRLLLVSTGNIPNARLERLLGANLPAIERAFSEHDYVELGRDVLLVHQ
jgi:predicted nuclease of predicted toxin-antitoxin system